MGPARKRARGLERAADIHTLALRRGGACLACSRERHGARVWRASAPGSSGASITSTSAGLARTTHIRTGLSRSPSPHPGPAVPQSISKAPDLPLS